MAIVTITNEVGGLEIVNDAWLTVTRTFYDAMATVENRLTYDQTDALDQLLRGIGGGLTTDDVELIITAATAPLIARIAALENAAPAPYLTITTDSGAEYLTITTDPAAPYYSLN